MIYADTTTRTLDNQKVAIEEIRRVLKQGRYFLGAENMLGSWVHQGARKILKGKNIGWRHLKISEIEWLFKDFSSTQFRFFGFLGSFYMSENLNAVFSKMDSLLSVLLPKHWLYIGFIRCKK